MQLCLQQPSLAIKTFPDDRFLDDDVHSLRHPRQHHSHLRTVPIAHWIWTRYQRAQMRQDFQRTSGQGHQNFPSRHHQKEKCWNLLTPLRRCQVFQVQSQMLQSSLSIATECWILERRLAGGFILNLSSRESILSHRKSILQLFWWERGIISLRTHQAHLSQRLWTERILHLRGHTPLDTTSPRLDSPTDTTMNLTVRWMTICFWLAAVMKCIQNIFLLMTASLLR